MKKLATVLIITFSPLIMSGQNVNSIIRDIRSEYNQIVKNKNSFNKTVFNIKVNADPYYCEEDEMWVASDVEEEKIITFYIDESTNQIRQISLYEASIFAFTIRATLTDYYLKDDRVFFIFQRAIDMPEFKARVVEDRFTIATERRIYTVGNIERRNIENCVKYLYKSVEGTFSDVNELLSNLTNTEKDCSKLTEIRITPTEELIDIYNDKNEFIRINDEPPSMFFYNILFGQ